MTAVMDISKTYFSLNKTLPKRLVYGVGIHSGFFSEINMMTLAVVYCLHHKIQFNLHSSNANFRLNKGWQDYFLPFCPEQENRLLDTYNKRYEIIYKTNFTKPRRMYRKVDYKLKIGWTKIKSNANYLTFDLWDEILNRKLERFHYFIPELNINGDLQHACNKVIDFIWRFKPQTESNINQIINGLSLPEEYIGFQIRRGDKNAEHKHTPIDNYIFEAAKRSSIRNAFVLTDDFEVIEKLKTAYPEWNFYTLCRETEKGYTHNSFYNNERSHIYNGIIRLLANIEILRQSELFIGTFSANPSMFLGMIMDKNKTISVDVPWQVWYGKEENR